jgi:hypothetical protein
MPRWITDRWIGILCVILGLAAVVALITALGSTGTSSPSDQHTYPVGERVIRIDSPNRSIQGAVYFHLSSDPATMAGFEKWYHYTYAVDNPAGPGRVLAHVWEPGGWQAFIDSEILAFLNPSIYHWIDALPPGTKTLTGDQRKDLDDQISRFFKGTTFGFLVYDHIDLERIR